MTEEKKDMNLEALVSKLQTEGVDKANAEGAEIKKKAEAKAEDIVKKAEEEAAKLREKAQVDADLYQKNAVSSIELAGRDLLLALKGQIKELFDNAFKSEIAVEIDKESLLQDAISTLVNKWTKGKGIEVQINDKKTDLLLKIIQTSVKKEFQESVELKNNKNITSGFRIFMKDDEVNYDFSEETIIEGLKVNLNPKIAKLLDGK